MMTIKIMGLAQIIIGKTQGIDPYSDGEKVNNTLANRIFIQENKRVDSVNKLRIKGKVAICTM